MIVNSKGVPIEFIFSPGSEADIRGLHRLEIALPSGSHLFADAAYTDYAPRGFFNPGEGNLAHLKKKEGCQKKSHTT